MKLRYLELKDAPLMLEWMHDGSILETVRDKYKNRTITDCENFIRQAVNAENSIHLAIATDEDEYMGTVSLKNIDRNKKCAELSIVIRKIAMGRGYAWYGLEEIISKAFEDFGLETVYWCVLREDERSIRFYNKHNFHEVFDVPESILDRYKENKNLKWYSILKGDTLDDRKEVAGCRIIRVKTVPTVGAGELSFFEATRDVPFDIRRIYYISKVPEGIKRGFHAHKKLKQLLFCPYGRIQIILENRYGREEIELSDPSVGILIEEPTWREMLWLQNDSVLCVAASDFYDAADYIRSYDEFKKYEECISWCL